MTVSLRPYLAAGLAAATVSAAVVGPSLPRPEAGPSPRIELAAAVTPFDAGSGDPGAVTAQFLLPGWGLPGVGEAIITAYDTVEPWVAWVVDLAAYAVGWVPGFWWLSGQIEILYYDVIEPIAQSVVYSFADLISGYIGLGEAVSNVLRATLQAGIDFIWGELGWILPPLPPIPPFQGLSATGMSVVGTGAGVGEDIADGDGTPTPETPTETDTEEQPGVPDPAHRGPAPEEPGIEAPEIDEPEIDEPGPQDPAPEPEHPGAAPPDAGEPATEAPEEQDREPEPGETDDPAISDPETTNPALEDRAAEGPGSDTPVRPGAWRGSGTHGGALKLRPADRHHGIGAGHRATGSPAGKR
ncbi:hypothetical protein [uncultured Mycolicibacterium sp.]|uniref:hypothetical protein n=1 Tax=uncultured Mycolicibacterium sp. TaxID=2320817 RepID=UPI002605AE9B|nr:hypothetical protein [uncultured Mycolicibacterium sp.]